MIFDLGAITNYYPYWVTNDIGARVKNPKFDKMSGCILDIKENGNKTAAAKALFLPLLLTRIKEKTGGTVFGGYGSWFVIFIGVWNRR